MEETSSNLNKLQTELAYYKKQLDQMSGDSIKNDFILSSMRHALKQKTEAFSLLTNLQREFSVTTPLPHIYTQTVKAMNAQLTMDYSIFFLPTSVSNVFKAAYWHGIQEDQKSKLEFGELEISPDFQKTGKYILFNKTSLTDEITTQIKNSFPVNYFIGVPVLLDEHPVAFIISGRKYEKIPFIPALDKGDAETLMAISGLISTLIQNKMMMELRLQKADIEKQKEAISEQRDDLELTLNELRKTQALLIQKEKMASLGELTAGIAHEIQNPLNFVNNFSDVNMELLDELKEEAYKGNIDELKSIAADIKKNEEKINHHGKRADAIVKGMLQHSRSSTGIKELADINVLAEEYLRLAYHGLRAKDNSFNVTMKTNFEENIGNINIIPQDIGRVLLNLYNNSFYAVGEKKKQYPEEYDPTISVATKKTDNRLTISVKDNGNGIPQKIVDKIFQPFFTTKPTGQGTGLGLSLSYDIIKTHGGELKVNTKEGEYAEFVVTLPF